MELPTFRTPNFKHIMTSLWDRVKAFLKRAGTIIFALAVVLWGLVSWPQPPEAQPVQPSITAWQVRLVMLFSRCLHLWALLGKCVSP